MDIIAIKNEEDAYSLLKQALSDKLDPTTQIEFKGWPVFKLTISGKDFDGTIPTRIMPPILELQSEIYRIYCRAAYYSDDTRKLKASERELLELIVSVNEGSSEFITELFKSFNKIVKSSNMTGNQVVFTFVSIALILVGGAAWKDWNITNEKKHALDSTVKMSQEETKRTGLILRASSQSPQASKSKIEIDNFKNHLAKKLKDSDELKINDKPIINGARAAIVVPPPKLESKEIRVDGEFILNEVKFPKRFGGAYRFSVTRIIDNKTFMVEASPDVLSRDQLNDLREGSFGIKKMSMEINAKELRGNISSAQLVSIKLPPEK